MSDKPCLRSSSSTTNPTRPRSVKDPCSATSMRPPATAPAKPRIADREEIQVVMSDQRMPEMTGVQFLADMRCKHARDGRSTSTSTSDLDAVTDAINEGNVYRYVTKPYDPDELKTVLKQADEHFKLQENAIDSSAKCSRRTTYSNPPTASCSRRTRSARSSRCQATSCARRPTMVVGLAEMAQLGHRSAMRAWLDKICNASQRLRHRVDQMTTLLQAERFQRQQQRETISVAELCGRAAEEVATFIVQRKQNAHGRDRRRARVRRREQITTASCSSSSTRSNSRRTPAYHQPDGDRDGKEGRHIRVTDSGQGIEPACCRVFEPFFTRFDVSHHRSGTCEFDRRGLGLGLPMVKAFVEMHGGTVTAESFCRTRERLPGLVPIFPKNRPKKFAFRQNRPL